jgi:hypothetical protein
MSSVVAIGGHETIWAWGLRYMAAKVNFVIAGAQKGGTTALHALLRQHPQLFLPLRKEIHFFDRPDFDPADYPAYERNFAEAREDQVVGEATPIYAYWPGGLERIHDYNPEMKIVLSLREPGARAFSNWAMQADRGLDPRPFSKAIRAKDLDRRPRRRGYLSRGAYADQIARALDLFGQERVHVIIYEQFRKNPNGVLSQLMAFLGVENWKFKQPQREVLPYARSDAPKAPSETDRAFLEGYYHDDIRRVEALLGRDLTKWWRQT